MVICWLILDILYKDVKVVIFLFQNKECYYLFLNRKLIYFSLVLFGRMLVDYKFWGGCDLG